MDNQLVIIAQNYIKRFNLTNWRQEISELYDRAIREREKTLIDAAAATAAINAIYFSDKIDFDKITPQMEEAFHLAYPNVDIKSLVNMDPDEIVGILNGWKGKYFEVLVRDELNNGNWVGDIHLEPGQYAELAESATQPGWDLQIFNEDGSIAEALQLKATNSLGYVQKALEKYPDIDVLTTSEVFEQSDSLTDQIINSGISNDDLTNAIYSPMESLFDSPTEEVIEDILPFLPFIIIAFTEGRKVLVGKKAFEVALTNALERIVKTGLSMGVGALVYYFDGGLLSLPATFLTKIGFDRFKISSKVEKKIIKKQLIAKQLLLEYRPKLLLT